MAAAAERAERGAAEAAALTVAAADAAAARDAAEAALAAERGRAERAAAEAEKYQQEIESAAAFCIARICALLPRSQVLCWGVFLSFSKAGTRAGIQQCFEFDGSGAVALFASRPVKLNGAWRIKTTTNVPLLKGPAAPRAGQLNEAELQAQTLAATLADVEARAAQAAADASQALEAQQAEGAGAAAAAAAAAEQHAARDAELTACRAEVMSSL